MTLAASDKCELCQSSNTSVVLDLPAPSLGTDGAMRDLPLIKVRCLECGLIRNGYQVAEDDLVSHYGEAYGPGVLGAVQEPLFYTSNGPISASAALRDWILDAVRAAGLSMPHRMLEVGCGAGALMNAFKAAMPDVDLIGIDLDKAAAGAARQRGLDVRVAQMDSLEDRFDAIVSVAVMEHLPSPLHFLRALQERLTEGGWAAVVVPVQDGGNRDIFFWDHLFHFHSAHVAALGRKAGFACVFQDASHPLHAGYSLTLLASDRTDLLGAQTGVAADADKAADAVRRWQEILARLDDWLDGLHGRKLTVFGLGETFDFLRAYSKLRRHAIVVGLDDNRKRTAARDLGFSIAAPTPEALAVAEALLVTFKPGEKVISWLKPLTIPIFTVE